MEILAFIGSILGVTAALINRKQVVVHITNDSSSFTANNSAVLLPADISEAAAQPTKSIERRATIGGRCIRTTIALFVGVGAFIVAVATEPDTMGPVSWLMGGVLLSSLTIAAYQVVLVGLLLVKKLLR